MRARLIKGVAAIIAGANPLINVFSVLRFLLIICGTAVAFTVPNQASAANASDTIIVFDASGSMWGQVSGQTKIEAARSAARTMLETWPVDSNLGVIAYGHRRKGDCKDIELIVPLSLVDSAAIADKIDTLTPTGKTPITASLIEAGAILKDKEGKANVILISDGIETCQGDPCAAAETIKASGAGFTAFVIGFDIGDAATKAQLQCIATKTGGLYFDAKDANELGDALKNASSAAQGKKIELPATEPEAPLEGNLQLRFALSETSDPIVSLQPSADLGWRIARDGEDNSSYDYVESSKLAIVEPGSYEIALDFGVAKAKTKVIVTADKLTDVKLVLNAGIIFPKAELAAGMALPNAIFWEVLNASDKSQLTYSFDFAPRLVANSGNYVLQATIDALPPISLPFSIVAGDTAPIVFPVAAGAISFSAPNALFVTFAPGAANTENFSPFVMSSVENGTRYIAPGTYKVIAEYAGGVSKEAIAIVENGKTVEVELKAN